MPQVGFTANSLYEKLFIASPAQEVFGGGLPGGGKTYTLMGMPLCAISETELRPRCLHPKYEGWCFRRNEGRDQGNLQTNVQYAREFFTPLGGQETGNGTRWKFPQGGTFNISHMAEERDWTQIQGHEVADLLFDELPEFTEDQYGMSKAWCRAAAPDLIPRVRSTGNPIGPGVAWVKKRFVSVLTPFKIHSIEDEYGYTTRQFIPFGFRDNPALLANDPNYEARLSQIPNPHIRRAFLSRSAIEAWNVMVGAFFEFDSTRHIVEGDEKEQVLKELLASRTRVVEAFDYGGKVATCMLWMATHPDGTIFVTDCYYAEDKPLEVHIPAIKSIRRKWKNHLEVTVGDGTIWAKKAHYVRYTSQSIGAILQSQSIFVVSANKDKQSGFETLHRLLYFDADTPPKMRFFDNVRPLIDEIVSAVQSDQNQNDIREDCEDHALDALRYGAMHIHGVHKTNSTGVVRGSIMDDLERQRKKNRVNTSTKVVWGI